MTDSGQAGGDQDDPSENASGNQSGNQSGSPSGNQSGDDTRQRFREALERKRGRQHASAAGVERDGSEKSHGATGPTKARNFRRKSG